MSDKPTVYEALSAVMADMNAVGKNSVNEQQRFKFRGIDAVMNAAHASLSKHGVFFVPQVEERLTELRQTKNGGGMNVVHLRVRFAFYGPAGDHVDAVTWGEAQDAADKATNKALSAALKYALLQTLCIPTEDMEDSDQNTVEASRNTAPPVPPVETDDAWLTDISNRINAIDSKSIARGLWEEVNSQINAAKCTQPDGQALKGMITSRTEALDQQAPAELPAAS